MPDYRDRTALISGGGSGIGLGLARALAARGARVAIADISSERLASGAAALRAQGATVITLQFDVADQAGWKDAAREIDTAWGPIHFLGLNAGIGIVGHPIASTPVALWQKSWDVMFMGVVHGLQACVPNMRTHAQPGHVMMTSSIGGVRSSPGTAAYSVVKTAVIALAEILREELKGSALTNSVLCPQAVKTDLPAHSTQLAAGSFSSEAQARIESMLVHGIEPDAVGELVLERAAAGDFYIFTHDDARDEAQARYKAMCAGMRKGLAIRPVEPASAAD